MQPAQTVNILMRGLTQAGQAEKYGVGTGVRYKEYSTAKKILWYTR